MADARAFVVQRHDTGEGVHWDLMLEDGEALATWQLEVPPEEIGVQAVTVDRIADHAKRFLTYEGPLRSHPGSVRIHDRGTYTSLSMSDNEWRVSIEGKRMSGVYYLRREAGPLPSCQKDVWSVVRES